MIIRPYIKARHRAASAFCASLRCDSLGLHRLAPTLDILTCGFYANKVDCLFLYWNVWTLRIGLVGASVWSTCTVGAWILAILTVGAHTFGYTVGSEICLDITLSDLSWLMVGGLTPNGEFTV